MEFNLADLWERVVDAVPDREAVVCATRRFTFREVDERANRLAHHLAMRGIGPGDRVGAYLRNRNEYPETMLATLKLRAVPVNVNFRYVAEELRFVLDDADVAAIVVQREFLGTLEAIRPKLPLLHDIIVVEDGTSTDATSSSEPCYEELLTESSPERDFGPRSADDVYIVYTGGTTGMPKGVMWRSEDIFFAGMGGGNPGREPITRPEEIADHLDYPIRCLPAPPLMHGTANWIAMRTFFGGGTLVLSPERTFDPERLWHLIEAERVTFLVIVGDAFARPLVDALGHLDAELDLSALRWVLSSGAIFSPSVKQEWIERIPKLAIIDGFGSSETGTQGQAVTMAGGAERRRAQFDADPDVEVFDDENRPAAIGEVGRLARRGHIPIGYHKDEAKTAATFPTINGVRWSIAGDYATRGADGTITVLGRGSVCINTGGEKVYPEEVESVLKGHADVIDALVVGVPDERWGERVVAVVAARSGSEPSLDSLNEIVRQHVAGYKAPRDLVLVPSVRRSPTGKPDYAWAREIAMTTLGAAQ